MHTRYIKENTNTNATIIYTNMEFDMIQASLKEKLQDWVDLGIFMVVKAHENELNITNPNIYTLNIRGMVTNECKMIFHELKPYLKLPPDGPSTE